MAASLRRDTPLKAKDGEFYLADKKIVLLSGAIHYFRIVPQYWRDRLQRIKAAGLNCIETYVPWNLHEEVRGQFTFDGILNLRKFIEIAKELDLYVLLRPGPYICSEWEFGGLPSWLLSDVKMEVRSAYQPYLDACDKYIEAVMNQVKDLQHSNGGPIIAVQIENEYGSYGNSLKYKEYLKQAMITHGVTEFFFTSDNGQGIVHGDVPGEQITCNFQEQEHGYLIYEYVKNVKRPGWPMMAMEFWTGWFDHWGEKHHVWPIEEFKKVLTWLLEMKSSVNFYMIHGGTTFGFLNGANEGLGATNEADVEPYAPDVTSYDYDAPIAENGDLTPKYHVIRELLQKYLPDQVPKVLPTPPAPVPRKAYGKIKFNAFVPLAEMVNNVVQIKSNRTLEMESLSEINNGGGQSFGFILYRSAFGNIQNVQLKGNVRDRAIVILNGKEVATVDWTKKNHLLTCDETWNVEEENSLDILVENCGRVNYANFNSPVLNNQRKGLKDGVLIDGKLVDSWYIYPLEFKKEFFEKLEISNAWQEGHGDQCAPSLHKGEVIVDGPPCDTWIDMQGWTKGVVWVNGFNLGRYWEIGPQRALYVPGPLLKQGKNEIIVLELHRTETFELFSIDSSLLGEQVIHKTVIPAKERAMIAALRIAVKMGSWVWKPIGYFMGK